MASIRNVINRLAPIQIVTSRIPIWSESLTTRHKTGHASPGSATSISWNKYTMDDQLVPLSSLIQSKSEVKVFAIGEIHHQPSILKLQLQLLDILSRRYANEIVLVAEYFNLSQAQLLSDFNSSRIDVQELAAAYAESDENFDIVGHLAPLLLLARENAVPVVAGFPPREWAKDFLQNREAVLSSLHVSYGFDRPEDTEAGKVAHEAYFESLLSGNAPRETVADGESRKGARIFPAQLLKDSVMAWSIDQQLARGNIVIALAGLGHLEYGFGVLERVRTAKREEQLLIVCKSRSESELWLQQGNEEAGNEGAKHSAESHSDKRAIADAIYLYDTV